MSKRPHSPTRRDLLRWGTGAMAGVAVGPRAWAESSRLEADVCVFGATAAGVVAAVTAARLGAKVVLVGPDRHLGGLTSGGLGQTDIGNKAAIGGTSREFYQRVLDLYTERYGSDSPQVRACNGGFRFEPSVAEALLEKMVAEAGLAVYREQRLKAVRKRGNRITELETDGGDVFRARMFIDATYEGDLLAAAGVSFTVGREANAKYDETLNGIQFGHRGHAFQVAVDPYRIEGQPTSGLLKGITSDGPGTQGDGDHRVQAYNFRMCLTDDPNNQIPFPKPPGYDPDRFELLLRYLNRGYLEIFGNHQPMPNRKTDTNNHGAFGTDNIGMNYRFPTGDRVARSVIFQDHVDYQQGLMWFLANDPRVPDRFRATVGKWGLAKDEFPETGGWPHQLYVREARRMVSAYVMTEHNCRGKVKSEDPVSLAAYNMDSHHVRRIVRDGRVVNEGDVQVPVSPYPISYRAIVPREAECANLLVPVCLSCSHISYGSIRMEPVFMILGQSAATAAVFALKDDVAVQRVDYSRLREQLLADRQVLEWTGAATPGGDASRTTAIEPRSFKGVALDDAQAERVGEWVPSARAVDRKMGNGYIHDGNANKGRAALTYTPDLPTEGEYEVILYSPPNPNRATNVPVLLKVNGGAVGALNVNQREAGSGLVSLGRFRLPAGRATTVTVSNEGTDGYVVADGIQFVPVG